MISGFDTASSIALLAVTALAKKGPNGTSISNSQIVILPVSSLSYYMDNESC
jgi:high-affinity nickel-transport protein